jgi:polyhydroxybutyrate depolymerase
VTGIVFSTPEGPRRCLVQHPVGVTEPLPVVLILHGSGATAAWALEEIGWSSLADRVPLLTVAPEGARPEPSRPPGFLDNPQVWNDGSPQGLPPRPDIDDVAFLDQILDYLPRHYHIDPRRVYLTGFSNGAGMAFRYAAERGQRVAAIAPVAGYCWEANPRPTRAVPTLYLVGDADPLVPLEGGNIRTPWGLSPTPRPPVRQTLQRWAGALGCPTEPARIADTEEATIAHYGPGRDGATLTAYTIHGLGHHWPGGRGQLNPRLAGPASDRVRANELIWDFFCQHALP